MDDEPLLWWHYMDWTWSPSFHWPSDGTRHIIQIPISWTEPWVVEDVPKQINRDQSQRESKLKLGLDWALPQGTQLLLPPFWSTSVRMTAGNYRCAIGAILHIGINLGFSLPAHVVFFFPEHQQASAVLYQYSRSNANLGGRPLDIRYLSFCKGPRVERLCWARWVDVNQSMRNGIHRAGIV